MSDRRSPKSSLSTSSGSLLWIRYHIYVGWADTMMQFSKTNQFDETHSCCPLAVALADILDAFDLPENEKKIEEARDSAGNDMLKMMQIVFPITTQIQMSVIGKYGFPEDGDGEKFEQFCRFESAAYESHCYVHPASQERSDSSSNPV